MSDNLKKSIEEVIAPWQVNAYFANAEKQMHIFWDEGTIFRRPFEKLDLTQVVELAVVHGRHAERVATRAGKFVVLDVFEEHLDFCRQRLKEFNNIKFQKCDGANFDGVDDNWATSIFCFDAMVHFSPDIVKSYLNDTFRILKPGGMALYHHSNYPAAKKQHYGQNPHARNRMTKEWFGSLCEKANLDIVESMIIDWGGVKGLDCVTLVEKSVEV